MPQSISDISYKPKINYWKILFTVFFAWYFITYAISDPLHVNANWNLVDNVDLIIHEAGHWIFMLFGQFMHILGGSLTQILVPMIFVGYFFIRCQYYSASVMLFWVGENIFNVATYLGDSVVQKLDLLGGNSGDVIHDWNYLLTDMHLLNKTDRIANDLHGLSFAIIIIAIVLCLWFSIDESVRNKIKSYIV